MDNKKELETQIELGKKENLLIQKQEKLYWWIK